MVNQHSRNITKLKNLLQLHLVLQETFYQQVHFIPKDNNANHLSYGTLGTFVACIGAQLLQLPCRVFLADFSPFS